MAEQLHKIIIPVALWCPYCGTRHVDETRKGKRWDRCAHTTHRCQDCGEDFDVYVSGRPQSDDDADVGEIMSRAWANASETAKPEPEDGG